MICKLSLNQHDADREMSQISNISPERSNILMNMSPNNMIINDNLPDAIH